MKMSYFPTLLTVALATAFVSVPSSALASTKTKALPTLQISVDVPPTWRPFLEDDIADAFFYRIRDAFHREGFKGEITEISRGDEVQAAVPYLDVSLMEWRIDRVGNVDCTFSASLKKDGQAHSLGLFNGTSIVWTMGVHDRWDIQQGLDDSAQSAARDLYRKLVAKNLIPAPAKK